MPQTTKHDALLDAVAKWLRAERHQIVIIRDLDVGLAQRLDILSFSLRGPSMLVEVKRTYADYEANESKQPVQVGEMRWFATPPHLLPLDAVAWPYGLLEVTDDVVSVVREPGRFDLDPIRRIEQERHALIHYAAQLEHAAVFGGAKARVLGRHVGASPAHQRWLNHVGRIVHEWHHLPAKEVVRRAYAGRYNHKTPISAINDIMDHIDSIRPPITGELVGGIYVLHAAEVTG